MEATGTINDRPCVVTDHDNDLIIGFMDLPDGDETIFILIDGYSKIRSHYETEIGYSTREMDDQDGWQFNESEVMDAVKANVFEWIEERFKKVKVSK